MTPREVYMLASGVSKITFEQNKNELRCVINLALKGKISEDSKSKGEMFVSPPPKWPDDIIGKTYV